MNNLLSITLSLVAGLVLGGIFFGGLWWTIRRAAKSPYAPVWFGVSFIVRIGLVLSGLYVVSGGHWVRLVMCLIGFTLARIVIIRITQHTTEGGS